MRELRRMAYWMRPAAIWVRLGPELAMRWDGRSPADDDRRGPPVIADRHPGVVGQKRIVRLHLRPSAGSLIGNLILPFPFIMTIVWAKNSTQRFIAPSSTLPTWNSMWSTRLMGRNRKRHPRRKPARGMSFPKRHIVHLGQRGLHCQCCINHTRSGSKDMRRDHRPSSG